MRQGAPAARRVRIHDDYDDDDRDDDDDGDDGDGPDNNNNNNEDNDNNNNNNNDDDDDANNNNNNNNDDDDDDDDDDDVEKKRVGGWTLHIDPFSAPSTRRTCRSGSAAVSMRRLSVRTAATGRGMDARQSRSRRTTCQLNSEMCTDDADDEGAL
jgi:hypothetical protein